MNPDKKLRELSQAQRGREDSAIPSLEVNRFFRFWENELFYTESGSII